MSWLFGDFHETRRLMDRLELPPPSTRTVTTKITLPLPRDDAEAERFGGLIAAAQQDPEARP